MADTKTPAMGAMHDILTLADYMRQDWEDRLGRLHNSGVPLNADGAGDGGGSGDGGDGGQGAGDGSSSTAAAGGDGSGGDDAALGDAGKAALKVERDARKAAEKQARELAAKVQDFEQRDMTEQQKLEQRATDAEAKVAPTALENLRLRVAIDKKLPVELIDRLQGSTKEEIETDADNLLKLVKGGSGNGGGSSFDGGARGDAPATDMDTLIRQQAGFA